MLSMTGFGSGQANGEPGSVTIEMRSVNSRYLDLQFRLPDELRMAEMVLREQVSKSILRGKLEVRASYVRAQTDGIAQYPQALLQKIRSTYLDLKTHIPELSTLTVADVMQWPDPDRAVNDPNKWVPLCTAAGQQALSQLIEAREREGCRLVETLCLQAQQVQDIVDTIQAQLPAIMQAQMARMAQKLRETLEQACPEGIAHITGQELSERLAAEASMFSLRADVAEELDRLKSHLQELRSILLPTKQTQKSKGHGKRLDFLFQEMNREANTLGSKSAHMDMTRAAIDLKLVIEQMREQIQNLE